MWLCFAQDDEGSALSFSLTEDFETRYWRSEQRLSDPSDVPVFNYIEQVNRIVANVGSDGWLFGLQLDQVSLLANRYYLNDQLRVERDLTSPSLFDPIPGDVYINPEKVYMKVKAGSSEVTLGDFYMAFGRGVALNLSRNVDIDIDSSIQGVSAVLRPGAWDITALAGQLNRQQVFQDNPNIGLVGDRRHLVGGLRVERFGLGPANVGAHSVVYNFAEEEGWAAGFENISGTPDVVIGGLTTELAGVGGVDWYLEGDVVSYPTEALNVTDDDDSLGYALYGSAAFYPGALTVLVEGKRYKEVERISGMLASELV